MRVPSRLHRSGRVMQIGAALVLSLAVAGVGIAASSALTYTPQKADQITNIDILRTQIANYYGDPTKSGTFSPTSNYAQEAESVAAAGARWLKAKAGKSPMQAIVLDVDDTTLTTWNYEVFSNWAYNPGTNGTFVTEQRFPATPGMVDMVKAAAAEGYTVFFLTGRPMSQYDATMGNLTSDGIGVDAGYPTPEAPVHEARGRVIPRLPRHARVLRRRDRGGQVVRHDRVQVGHARLHRVDGLRHRRRLR